MFRLPVQVQPRASRNEVRGWENGALKIRVTAAAAEGAANDACLKLLAAWLDVPKSRLAIVFGRRTRQKVIEVAGIDGEYLRRRLAQHQIDFPPSKPYNEPGGQAEP